MAAAGGAGTVTQVDSGRRAVLRALTAAGIGVLAGGFAHGFLYERHRIGVTRATLPVSGLPAALDGLRVVMLSDLHLSPIVPREDLDEAVRLAMLERPDLIVLGGDYISFMDRAYAEPCAEIIAPLSAPNGIFAVLGNHDDDYEMPKTLERRGVEVLKDARTRVTIRGEQLDFIGLRFWTRATVDLARLLKGAGSTTVLLAHDPRRLQQAAALNIPLMLSGHTHGGQIVLPGIGAIAAKKFPVVEGMARRENTTLFVSRGIGTIGVPVRINCPPEVAVLTLSRHVATPV
jgi:predicted MPP superfamily phosphohydrolase